MTLRQAILTVLRDPTEPRPTSRRRLVALVAGMVGERPTKNFDRLVRDEIPKLIGGEDVPIIAGRRGGYMIARTRAEGHWAIATLQSYIDRLQQRLDDLRRALQATGKLFPVILMLLVWTGRTNAGLLTHGAWSSPGAASGPASFCEAVTHERA